MGRVFGVLAIVAGTLVVGFNPNRWDTVVMNLPRGHGIHLHEIIGVALVGVGTVLLWIAPQRRK